MALVVDTGPVVAALISSDPSHEACAQLLRDTKTVPVIPAPVLIEVDQLLRSARPDDLFTQFLDDVDAGAYRVIHPTSSDLRRAKELLVQYADLRVGFVDAAVLAIVERLGETKLATLDHRHFGAMRPRHTDSLELLPA